MKYHHLVLVCFTYITIFSIEPAYSDSKVTIFNTFNQAVNHAYIHPKGNLELRCVTSDTAGGEIAWERDGKRVDSIKELKGRLHLSPVENNTLKMTLEDLKESDVANYTCSVYNNKIKQASATIAINTATSAKWGVKVPKNTNVVEGEKLTLTCELFGELKLEWWYYNTTSGENTTKLTEDSDRVRLESYVNERQYNVTNGKLIIDEVNMGDRGEYMCIGRTVDGQSYNKTCTVRIKDKYAALWPFLGICAEVFVLCAIIFIYEKKRNKTELEESDTDQSPDQKNTPDHGKESNLRHRQ